MWLAVICGSHPDHEEVIPMKLRNLALAVAFVSAASLAHAWSECGHHIITLLAYDRLEQHEQSRLFEILEQHPRYAEDFEPSPKIKDVKRWRIGRIGYWPDIARSQPKYNRPTWHYQLGANLVIGDKSKVTVPQSPFQVPEDATLETQELYIAQAFTLCLGVASDNTKPAADRALALCWLAHLAGDAHQPCHAGSLYAETVFPDGDRGANRIKVKQGRNLHALWDGLLGGRFDEGDVKRRLAAINADEEMPARARRYDALDTAIRSEWLAESERYAVFCVYTKEVLQPVKAVQRGLTEEVPAIDLSDKYLETAGRVAKMRAFQAGFRLAKFWKFALNDGVGADQ